MRGSGKRVSGFLEVHEGLPAGVADIEAATVAAQMSFPVPAKVPFHPADGIEAFPLDETFRQAKCHGGVIGPLTRLQPRRTAPYDVAQRLKGSWSCKLDGGAESISRGKTEKGSSVAGNQFFTHLLNHEHIGQAIAEAALALNRIVAGVRISRDSHYQLANRVAYNWKPATMGVPVLLVYPGFTGDNGIADVGPPLRDHAHWESIMRAYMEGVLPDGFLERWLPCGKAHMKMIVRSRPALAQSPPARNA